MKESTIRRLVISTVLLCISSNAAFAQVVFTDGFETPLMPVVITDFSATPSTINEGGNTLINWATENAESCEIMDSLGEFNGPVSTNNSVILVIATAGSYTFTLTCVGFEGPVMAMITIEVVAPPCDPSPLSGVISLWSNYWEKEFPEPNFDNKFATIPRTGFLALQFDTADIIGDGRLTTIETTATDGLRLGTISTCPGDFDVEPECDHVWGNGGSIRWETNGRVGVCHLNPNTTYYFNVTFTDGQSPRTTSCKSAPCIPSVKKQSPAQHPDPPVVAEL
jgi:hypothetical protein